MVAAEARTARRFGNAACQCRWPSGDRWTLGATFAPLISGLCRRCLRCAGSLCHRCRNWSHVEFRLGVAHGLSQHRAKLVLCGRLRSYVGLLCAHSAKLRRANLNLKVAALGSYLNDEWCVSHAKCCPLARMSSPSMARLPLITKAAVLVVQAIELGL